MTKKILGIGAALVDVLANVSEEWMAAQGVQKGGMNHVDWPQMEKFLGELNNPIRVPGGSTCNTMVGISKLGGESAAAPHEPNSETLPCRACPRPVG